MKPILITTAVFLATVPPAGADDDHDRVLQAVQAGEVLSLRTILEQAEKAFPGDLIEVELEDEDSRTIYEIKLLTPQGRVLKLKYDARTGDLLTSRERDRR